MAAEEMNRHANSSLVRVAGVLGETDQATREAAMAVELGYDCALLSLGRLAHLSEDQLVEHCRAVAEVIPLFGFYLQSSVGGLELPYSFWVRFCEIEQVVAIKVAAFNRYHTLDVIRATAESQRDDISLYTGNDDNIVLDLLTPFEFRVGKSTVQRRFVGGLLGQWAVGTRAAVRLFEECRAACQAEEVPQHLLVRAGEVTDYNAALFDAAHQFRGCIPGINEVLRRQGLMTGRQCLDPDEVLSLGQLEEIGRVQQAYPHLSDDDYVAEHLHEWM
jgi:hypothetical protein